MIKVISWNVVNLFSDKIIFIALEWVLSIQTGVTVLLGVAVGCTVTVGSGEDAAVEDSGEFGAPRPCFGLFHLKPSCQ